MIRVGMGQQNRPHAQISRFSDACFPALSHGQCPRPGAPAAYLAKIPVNSNHSSASPGNRFPSRAKRYAAGAVRTVTTESEKKISLIKPLDKFLLAAHSDYTNYPSKELLLFEVIQEQQEYVNRELYQALSGIAGAALSAEKLTNVIFAFYKKTEEMLILKLIDAGDVELLVRKLPREIVEAHFQEDTLTTEKMLALFPFKKETDTKAISAAFHAVYFATLHKAEIGEQYDKALYALIYGIVTQIL